jgi:erythritol transport system substrate-binding protein
LPGCRPPDKRPLIFIIVPSQDNPFFKAEADAAAAEANRLGYRTRVDAHEDDAYRQDNLIDAAIASGSAAILLDNAGSEASIAAVRRATKAGIPVFLMDRAIDTDGLAKAQIIADNNQGARLVATEFARALHGAGDYAELLGRESDTNAQIRTHGFHSVLDSDPGLKLVSAQSANWSQSEAFSRTETTLQAHPEIKGIIAGNDTMALGALAQHRHRGIRRQPGRNRSHPGGHHGCNRPAARGCHRPSRRRRSQSVSQNRVDRKAGTPDHPLRACHAQQCR